MPLPLLYAVAPTRFRFAALASLAGRAPLGGAREVALASYLAARLADDVLPERGLHPLVRAERALHAKSWLSTLALPVIARPPLAALIDASAQGCAAAGAAVRALGIAASSFLDSAARLELELLATALERA